MWNIAILVQNSCYFIEPCLFHILIFYPNRACALCIINTWEWESCYAPRIAQTTDIRHTSASQTIISLRQVSLRTLLWFTLLFLYFTFRNIRFKNIILIEVIFFMSLTQPLPRQTYLSVTQLTSPQIIPIMQHFSPSDTYLIFKLTYLFHSYPPSGSFCHLPGIIVSLTRW